jgi:hypothetical protein
MMRIGQPFLFLSAAGLGALLGPPAYAQFWDKLTKPQITLNLTHPPRLGLNIKKVAFGPSNGPCSDEILDRLSGTLVSGGVGVMDRQNLQTVLAEQHLSLSGYVDQQSAVQMGKLLGPTALIFVKVSRCNAAHRRNYSDSRTKDGVVRTQNAIVDVHVRGTIQTIDLATGRIFSASPILVDRGLTNSSTDGMPEFPSEDEVRDMAVSAAAEHASTFFVNWHEQKQLYFFNDKDCNLSRAFAMLKVGDIDGTVRQSEENLAACKALGKPNSLAHAYYNAGLASILVNENKKAMAYLSESEKLKGGDIVTQTILQANRSEQLAAEMRRVTQRTEQFEQAQAAGKRSPAPSTTPAAVGAKVPTESLEERLTKLNELFKKGLISKEEFDAKKTQILKEM